MMKQKGIAKILNRDPADISRFLSGVRKPSWSLAKQLASLLPAKTIDQWKDATPDDLRFAFKHIERMNQEAINV